MELGCGLSKWNGPYFLLRVLVIFFFTYSMPPRQDYGTKDRTYTEVLTEILK